MEAMGTTRWPRLAQMVILSLLTGCEAPREGASAARGPGTSNLIISDQVHNGGVPGFFWLPPIAPVTAYGSFKAGLTPVVVIDELPPGTAGRIATYSVDAGTFGETVKTDELSHYMVNWDTRLFNVRPELTYRIRVSIDGVELGFADVSVGSIGRRRDVATSELIRIVDGRTLPIKFRIEADALNGGSCTPIASCEGHCGAVDDGCGHTLACGGCPAGFSCGGGGNANHCVGAGGLVCYPNLAPVLTFDGSFSVGIGELTGYRIPVSNAASFPADMFALTDAYGGCGTDPTVSSRTWVRVYPNDIDGAWEFCNWTDPLQMLGIWFGGQPGSPSVSAVYVEVVDWACGLTYRSNTVSLQ